MSTTDKQVDVSKKTSQEKLVVESPKRLNPTSIKQFPITPTKPLVYTMR